ncbi:hypothetical protein ACFOZY_00515 [Chungangia koreensis]|uniref:Uncharacterized protein n=1 Tax=Chungangia koreensis TaxID=752657 RepID=A0ABV8X3U3_9LACT
MIFLIGLVIIIAVTLLSIEVKFGKMIKQNEQILYYLSEQNEIQKSKKGIHI